MNALEKVLQYPIEAPVLKSEDLKVSIDVRWCSGCGSFAILSQVQQALPELGIPKEKICFVSGIGCSGRFPYYMDTYGFHSIHGRALAIASGLKISRKDLSIWVATGDGDCMSIGGNHMIHACRRNVDINVMMINNEIYSLTKGQYSPTSRKGQKTKSSVYGVIEEPFNPTSLALGSGATFVARGFDRDLKLLKLLMGRAARHKGLAFMEISTNCVIFNDGAFDGYTLRSNRTENSVVLTHGEPLVFGKESDKGIILDGYKPKVVSIAEGSKYSIDDLLVHDETDQTLAMILSNMGMEEGMPTPVGIFYAVEKPSFDHESEAVINGLIEEKGEAKLEDLLKGKESWTI